MTDRGHLISTDLAPSLEAAMTVAVRLGRLYLDRLRELEAMQAGEPVSDGLTLLASIEGEQQTTYDVCQSVIQAHAAFVDSLRRVEAISRCVTRPAGPTLSLVSAAAERAS